MHELLAITINFSTDIRLCREFLRALRELCILSISMDITNCITKHLLNQTIKRNFIKTKLAHLFTYVFIHAFSKNMFTAYLLLPTSTRFII